MDDTVDSGNVPVQQQPLVHPPAALRRLNRRQNEKKNVYINIIIYIICLCVFVSHLIFALGNSQIKPKSRYDDFLLMYIHKWSSAVIG